jgi:Uma2 family endonuclease
MSMVTLRKVTVPEYQAMFERGILKENERLELLGGEIRVMQPTGKRHMGMTNRFSHMMNNLLVGKAIVSTQNAISLTLEDAPQPDVAILRYRDDFYFDKEATTEDALLIIEIADTTLEYDRTEKLTKYAEAGIREVWIVNLKDNVIEVYREPGGNVYLLRLIVKQGQELAPLAFPELKRVWW